MNNIEFIKQSKSTSPFMMWVKHKILILELTAKGDGLEPIGARHRLKAFNNQFTLAQFIKMSVENYINE